MWSQRKYFSFNMWSRHSVVDVHCIALHRNLVGWSWQRNCRYNQLFFVSSCTKGTGRNLRKMPTIVFWGNANWVSKYCKTFLPVLTCHKAPKRKEKMGPQDTVGKRENFAAFWKTRVRVGLEDFWQVGFLLTFDIELMSPQTAISGVLRNLCPVLST